jgi:hypothetical protein
MTRFKVVLERTDTITRQAEILVEAQSPEEARQIILNDLDIDPGAYDDDLEPVAEETGEGKVAAVAPGRHVPTSLAS